jgi:2-polyprenyl-3-methyl-5-hydroxy-6-metoxy-1,4-benzoquinol methylase
MRLTNDEWVEHLSRSVTSQVMFNDAKLPDFPAEALQMGTVAGAGVETIRQAWAFASGVLERFETSPLFANPDKTLLDFGTGWGRISRCFLRDFRRDRMIGIDVNPELIELCKTIFPGPRFIQCNSLPPTKLANESIDFIVGFSVFSHLSEIACQAWAIEFAHLLKGGGMVALTTRSRSFFDWHKKNVVDREAGIPIFADYESAKAQYDAGFLVHSHRNLNPRNHYGETFIPEKHASLFFAPLYLKEFYEGPLICTMIFAKA